MNTTHTKPRILLVDDHAIFRSSLAMLLEQHLGMTVVGCCDKLNQAASLVAQLLPTLVIMDYHMPEGDALRVGAGIKYKTPHIKLIYLTGTQSAAALNQLLASNADGILHKELTPEELSQALAQVHNGQRAVSPQIHAKMPSLVHDFTEREFQLFKLLAQGHSSKEIASHLNISSRTVEKHRENLFKKADVKNVAQLMELGYKLKILDLEAGC